MPLDHTAFWDGWETWGGVAAAVAMPFYVGRARAAVQVIPYHSVDPDITDFLGRHVFVEWHLPLRLAPRLSLHGGGRVGVFQMRFDAGTGQQKHEQEVAAFAVAGASYELGPWAIHARTAYGTVLLSDPERQVVASVGVSRSFAMPEWLQEVLR